MVMWDDLVAHLSLLLFMNEYKSALLVWDTILPLKSGCPAEALALSCVVQIESNEATGLADRVKTGQVNGYTTYINIITNRH